MANKLVSKISYDYCFLFLSNLLYHIYCLFIYHILLSFICMPLIPRHQESYFWLWNNYKFCHYVNIGIFLQPVKIDLCPLKASDVLKKSLWFNLFQISFKLLNLSISLKFSCHLIMISFCSSRDGKASLNVKSSKFVFGTKFRVTWTYLI